MNDIKYLKNTMYDYKNNQFIIINNINNIDNVYYNYIIVKPIQPCYSHLIIDFIFPLYWIIKDIRNNYELKEVNLFIKKGNHSTYYNILKNNKYCGVYKDFLDIIGINNIIFEKDINTNLYFNNSFEISYYDEWMSHWQRGIWNSNYYYPQRIYNINNVLYDDNIIYSKLKNFVKDVKKYFNIKNYKTTNNLIIIDRKNDRIFDKIILDKIIKIIPEKINFNGIIILEDLTLKEQIELFSQQNIFIFRHGSCLINLLWIQENSIIFDLDHQSDRPRIIKRVCDLTNSKHNYMDYHNIDYSIIKNL
jgi:hypothetical protein